MGLFLILVSLIGWKTNGSVVFIAILLFGLIKFLGALLYILTGKIPLRGYRNTILLLLLGAVIGFVIFDLPSIYLFKIWIYQADIPNPFSDFVLYAIQSLGWGAFLLVFYDSYRLLNLLIDKNCHWIGLTHNRKSSENFFSILGVMGVLMFLSSVVLVLVGFSQSWWPATMAALGIWFILENIEFRTNNGKTLITRLSKGDLSPLVSIVACSVVLGFLFEYFNIISPKQHWVYYGLPFPSVHIAGLPIFLIVSWSWMYIIFLSVYEIIYKRDNLWT